MHPLERECRSYSHYLAGQAPTSYVIEKYMDYQNNIAAMEPSDRFDALLVSFSSRGPLCARLADSYASIWRKGSLLRRKLVLTLALLECTPPTFATLDRPPVSGWTPTIARLAVDAGCFAGSVAVSVALFAPIHIWMTVRGR